MKNCLVLLAALLVFPLQAHASTVRVPGDVYGVPYDGDYGAQGTARLYVYVDDEGKTYVAASGTPLLARGVVRDYALSDLLEGLERAERWAKLAKEHKVNGKKLLAEDITGDLFTSYGVQFYFESFANGTGWHVVLNVRDFKFRRTAYNFYLSGPQFRTLLDLLKKAQQYADDLQRHQERADELFK